MPSQVVSVASSRTHSFSKIMADEITLVEGHGVAGDAHAGSTVKHRSRVTRDASKPNLRQVHLIHAELFDELAANGFTVGAGDLGENITTRGVDLLALPSGTDLVIGGSAIITLTGLRNPCVQIERFQRGLLAAVLARAAGGALVRKTGVMAVVTRGGVVRVGDEVVVRLPDKPYRALAPV